MDKNLKCISIHLYSGYCKDVFEEKIKLIIKKIDPSVFFFSTKSVSLPEIDYFSQVVKKYKKEVGILFENDFSPELVNWNELSPKYFACKRNISPVKGCIMITPLGDFLYEDSGPTEKGFAFSDSLSNILRQPFCVKVMDSDYQKEYLTPEFISDWEKL